MRQRTAFVLVIALALTAGLAARADTAAPAEQHRNPIEWLLSDLGKLLNSAAGKLAKTTTARETADEAEDAAKSVQIQAKVSTAAPAPASEPEPAAAQTVTAAQAQTKPEKTFRNPLAWLFGDLARIFKPDLEIEQAASASAAPVAAKPAEAPAVIAESAAPPVIDATPDTAAGNTDVTDASDDGHNAAPSKNPITWLFRDLANLFRAPGDDAAPEITDTGDMPDTAVEAEPAQPVAPSPVEIVATNDVAAREASDETSLLPAPEAVAQATDTPAPAVLGKDVAPWVPRPNGNLFDPDDSLFTASGAPLLSVPAPAAATPVETADAATPAPAKQAIRQRAPQRPAARNHLALGHNHKAVTPDPVDDTLLDRVLESLFGIDEPVAAEETLANKVADRIVPEEKLDLGYISPDAKVADQELTRIGDGPLLDLDLVMGRDSIIGAPYDAAAFKAESCVERALHGSVFCLKELNWPAEIASSFATDTAFVLPGEGVVRYENGVASRIYAVFKASDFADVVKFMQHRFGPPQEREIGWMHMLEAPKLPNTTFRWQAFNADRTDAIVLEVRNFDDLRRSFADMDHGMVRLYRNGSRPIFKHISTMDLMLMQRRRVARAPVDVNQPPKQQ